MKREHIKLLVIAVVALGIGFLGGMEYKAYQIRSAIGDAFSDVFGEETGESDIQEEKPQASNDLTNKVGFEITNKSFTGSDFLDYNTFTFNFTNNTDKDIEGIKGYVNLNDLFGDRIKRVSFSYDEGIKAGESKLYRASIDYNQFIDEDIKLKQTELAKLKYDWEITTIIYTDGTQESY